MGINDIVMVVAVVLGPILAVQAQKMIEQWRENRARKLSVFTVLMATRGTPLSPEHVQALNMIDLEFSAEKPRERAVREAWKVYLDHLGDAPQDFQDPTYQAKNAAWTTRSNDCRVELLYTMGHVLGYDFDKVQLKKGVYTPKGHADTEFEQGLLRKGLLELLYNRRALPIQLTAKADQQEPEAPRQLEDQSHR